MEVVLSYSETAWICQISLRIMYDSVGESLAEPQVLKFGESMTDASEVENRLRQAQKAVLNFHDDDQMDLRRFLEDLDVVTEVSGFSRNVVRLEVSGAELVDVTFIDLPGIITNANQVYLTVIRFTDIDRNG